MAICETCGNDYAKSMEIRINGGSHAFDCFECAIHALAPSCEHCGCSVIGHGIEAAGGLVYCCAHCAAQDGRSGARDHLA